MGSIGVLAGQFQVARTTASYVLRGVAATFLAAQAMILCRVFRTLEQRPALVIVDKLKFDESSQVVTTAYHTRLGSGKHPASTHRLPMGLTRGLLS